MLADRLKEARKLIENGWCKNRFAMQVNDRLEYCAVGAMYSASKSRLINEVIDVFIEANDIKLRDVTHMPYYNKTITVSSWNDTNERTKEEVLEAFDKAIEFANNKELCAIC